MGIGDVPINHRPTFIMFSPLVLRPLYTYKFIFLMPGNKPLIHSPESCPTIVAFLYLGRPIYVIGQDLISIFISR